MAFGDRQHQTFRVSFHGLNTRLLADMVPVGKYPLAINVRADSDSRIKTRPGYDSGAGGFHTGASRITDMRAYTALGTDNQPRIIVHDSSGGVWLDDGVKKGTVGFGGTGASLIPYRPSQSPQSWMYVANATGYKKFSAPDASNNVTAQKVGIAEPQSPPDACPDGALYYEFTAIPNNYTPGGAAASWTAGGDCGGPLYTTNPRSSNASGDTVVAIFADPASVSPVTKTRYSVQLASTATYGVGETLIFNNGSGGFQNAEVEAVFPAINGGAALTVLSIFYTAGNVGKCIVVPSQFQFSIEEQLPPIERGSLIQIGSEVCLVLNVTVGLNNGLLAIETSTVSGHVAGETLTGIPAIVVAGITSAVVGQTVGGGYITDLITKSTGSGTLTQTLGTNPFTQVLGTLGTPQTDDYIHISLAASTPASITTFELDFDIGDGTFNQNVLSYTVPAASIASNFSGASQFTEIMFPISALVRSVGNDTTQTLAQCTKVRLKITISATVSLYFGSLWVGGGGQLDVGTAGAPYTYRVRPRSSITGAVGNPSPATRYGVNPRRQEVILSLPSASYDSQIDTWDIERFGGTVNSYRLVGSAPSTATTFTDNATDAAALAGQLLSFDNFEPWPTVDVPWTATVGLLGVTAITVYGTAITVKGPSTAFLVTTMRWLPGTLITLDGQVTYTLWTRPTPIAGGVLFRTTENMGAPTVTTLFVNEPLVANQNLPYLWGPDANGVIFGVGDPFRPGALYSSTQFSPDTTPNNIYDLTPPSEPLLGGEVIDGVSFVASSKRWWQLQAAFSTPNRWNPVEVPAGRGLIGPAHCTDGKLIYFWASDGIYSMIPGLPAVSLTDADIGNLFPHGGVPGQDYVYMSQTINAPSYNFAAEFRLAIINNTLRAHYFDFGGTPHCLVLDMSLDSQGQPRMAWSYDVFQAPIAVSYQPEQPKSTLLSTGNVWQRAWFADTAGKVYVEMEAHNDVSTSIFCVLSTPEWDGGDARIQKQFIEALVDCIPMTGITVIPTTQGAAVGVNASIGAASTRQLSIDRVGNINAGFPVENFMGLTLEWTDDFSQQCTAFPLTVNALGNNACGIMTYKWNRNSLTGPFWASSYPLKFVAVGIDASNASKLVAWVSTDGGVTWAKLDDSHAPTLTNNIRSFEGRYDGGTSVLVATMEYTTGRVAYHRIDMVAQTWAITNKQVIASVSSSASFDVSVDKRGNGNVGVFYTAADETVGGSPYNRAAFKESTDDGTTWGAAVDIGGDAGTAHAITMSRIQHGTGNRFHFIFTEDAQTLSHPPSYVQTLNTSNALSSRVNFASVLAAPSSIAGRPTSYNDGADKIAFPFLGSGGPWTAIIADADTPSVISTTIMGSSTTVAFDFSVCDYPMMTMDFASSKLYCGTLSGHPGLNTWTYEQNSSDGVTWTPNSEAQQIGATFPPSPSTAQHSNSLFFVQNGTLYMANISESQSFQQLFQLARVIDLPFPNPPQNEATWIAACTH